MTTDDKYELEIDSTGIEEIIIELTKNENLTLSNEKKNIDGTLIWTIIGTSVAMVNLCLELYKIVQNKKKVKLKTNEIEQNGLTIDKVIELIEAIKK